MVMKVDVHSACAEVQRLLAIWLVEIKFTLEFTPIKAWWICGYSYVSPCCEESLASLFSDSTAARTWNFVYLSNYFVTTRQIVYDLGLISNLQYRLGGQQTVSPCCEEELTLLLSDFRAARTWIIRTLSKQKISRTKRSRLWFYYGLGSV